MCTPNELRKELKKAGMPYGIIKQEGTWRVCGGDSHKWANNCLYVDRLDGLNARLLVREIAVMAQAKGQESRFVLEVSFAAATKQLAKEIEAENKKVSVVFAEPLITDKQRGIIVLDCLWEDRVLVEKYLSQKGPDIVAIRSHIV